MTRVLLMTIVVALVGTAVSALACPTCADAIPRQESGSPAQLASGFNASIYLMLAAPFLLVLLGGSLLVRHLRRMAGKEPPHRSAVAPPLPGGPRLESR